MAVCALQAVQSHGHARGGAHLLQRFTFKAWPFLPPVCSYLSCHAMPLSMCSRRWLARTLMYTSDHSESLHMSLAMRIAGPAAGRRGH